MVDRLGVGLAVALGGLMLMAAGWSCRWRESPVGWPSWCARSALGAVGRGGRRADISGVCRPLDGRVAGCESAVERSTYRVSGWAGGCDGGSGLIPAGWSSWWREMPVEWPSRLRWSRWAQVGRARWPLSGHAGGRWPAAQRSTRGLPRLLGWLAGDLAVWWASRGGVPAAEAACRRLGRLAARALGRLGCRLS